MNKYRKPLDQQVSPLGPADSDGLRAWTPAQAALGVPPVHRTQYVDVVLAHGQPETARAGHVGWDGQGSRAVVRWRPNVINGWWGVEKWAR